jgi:dihydrofolate synthase/folylpolyglutamate synthase
MTDRSLDQWLQFLESLHPREMELGLERVAAVASRLRLLAPDYPVITIAGTNGKGTTLAALEALLLESGRRVGAFTSPHLLRFNERIRVAGEEVADDHITAAFTAIDDARGDISLTYFEFATLAALVIFREQAVDICLLEVGLGGRLDATNIMDPDIAVVTGIALDHQQWLGDSLGQIAREKAGILRRGKPVVVADANPPQELLDRAAELGAGPVWCYGRDFGGATDAGEDLVEILDHRGDPVTLPLPQRSDLMSRNLCAALQVVSLLDWLPAPARCRAALARLVVPGRRQTVCAGGLSYLLDVAHNPASAAMLGEYLAAMPSTGRTLAVFSAMGDKDIPGMLTPLVGHFDAWFLADQPDNPRAAAAGDVAATLRSLGETTISVSRNLRQALGRARQLMRERDRLVVFGSFYTVAAALRLIESDREKNLAGAVS